MSSNFFSLISQLENLIDSLDSVLSGSESETVNINGQSKDTISKAIKEKFSSIQAMVQGRLSYETKAEMDAAGAPPNGELAEVWHDTTELNGLYGYSNSSWNKSSYDPFTAFSNRLKVSEGASTVVTPLSNQIFGLTVSEKQRVYKAGDVTSSREIYSTFTGWAAPFNWDGSVFNLIKIYYNIEHAGSPLRVRLWSSDKLTLLSETTVITTNSGFSWVPLNKAISTEHTPAGILYYSMDVVDKTSRLMPDEIAGYINVSDPDAYRQMYLTNGPGNDLTSWINASVSGNYYPPLELFNISSVNSQGFIDFNNIDADLKNIMNSFDITTKVGYSNIQISNGAFSEYEFVVRGIEDGISGYGQTLQKQIGKSINAVSIPGIPTSISDDSRFISKVYAEVRELNSSGEVLAAGSISVKKGKEIGALKIPLKSLDGKSYVTLTENDLPNVYWVGFWVEDEFGQPTAAGNATASVTGFDGSSQYKTLANEAWAGYSGNKSLAIETEFLSDINVSDEYVYNGDLKLSESEINKDLKNTILKTSTIKYDSRKKENTVNGPGYRRRSSPFCGWGADMDIITGSFNSVRLPFLARESVSSEEDRWHKIKVEVKDGNCQTGTVIAIAEIEVDSDQDILSDLYFLLKHPTTNENITISSSDFIQSVMGVTFRAVNINGGQAACGESTGLPNNYSGNSYHSVNNGVNWISTTNNPPLGIELVTLNNAVIDYKYKIRSSVEIPTKLDKLTIQMYGPDLLYAMEGHQINLYFDNIIAEDYKLYTWDVACSQGQHLDECFRLESTDRSNKNLRLQLYDSPTISNVLAEKELEVRVAGANSGSAVNRRCLFIGDSTTAGGQYINELINLSNSDVMDIETIGTVGIGSTKHEGRGGWRVDDYTTAGRVFYRFNVSGVTNEPAINSAVYSHNSCDYKVQENHLENGSGYIIFEKINGTSEPISSGSMIKNFGSGESTIGFDSWQLASGNPFWNDNTQKIDFSSYLEENNITIGSSDWIFIHLGINDVFGQSSDLGATTVALDNVQKLNGLIDEIHSHNSAIRVAIMTTIPPCKGQSAFGQNYGSGQFRNRYKRNILIYNQVMVDSYANLEDQKIYVCPVQYTIDPIHGYPNIISNVSSRSNSTVFRNTNSVHPNDSGYYQMADEVWAFLKYWE